MTRPPQPKAPPSQGLRGLPPTVWALAMVSLFMDLSSELVHGLLPVFMVSVLGASTVWVGLLEGMAEATAHITKVFSGALSDALGKRKRLVLFGYSLAALTKPLFAVAQGVGLVFAARFVDRIGKGMRGAPRDALMADVLPAERYGAGYGLRQSCDSIGAALGPLAAIGLMTATGGDFRQTFWWAVLPAAIAVVIIVVFVSEPPPTAAPRPSRRLPLRRAELVQLGPACWGAISLASLFALARCSEAFVLLRAHDVGMAVELVPLALLVSSAAQAVSAYPVGLASDRFGRRGLLLLGFAVLIAADLVLAVSSGPALVLCGAALWGLHLGLTQGVLSALVADTAPAHLRGTAFGVFSLCMGVTLLLASALAGVLWHEFGPEVAFYSAAGIAAFAVAVAVATDRGSAGRVR